MSSQCRLYYTWAYSSPGESSFIVAIRPSQARRWFASLIGEDKECVGVELVSRISAASITSEMPFVMQCQRILEDLGGEEVVIRGLRYIKLGERLFLTDIAASFYDDRRRRLIKHAGDLQRFFCNHGNEWVYRGQSDSRWMLESTITRVFGVEYRGARRRAVEEQLLRDFKVSAADYLDFVPANDWEWLAVAQHFGVPTRLLDWSRDPLVALFFASDPRIGDVDGTIFAMKFPQDKIGPHNCHPFDIHGLAAYLPERMFSRMEVQKGLFTIEPPRFQPFASGVKYEVLHVCYDKKLAIQNQLCDLGYSWKTLFPDIDGLSRQLQFNLRWRNSAVLSYLKRRSRRSR